MKIKVLIVEPEKEPYEKIIDNELETLQNIVYGLIEFIEMEKGVDLIINEEGKIDGLPFNRYITNDVIAGTFIIAGERNGKTISLSDDMIKKYKEYFKLSNHEHIIEMYKSKYESTSQLVYGGFIGGYHGWM